jgi:hypothetical protein
LPQCRSLLHLQRNQLAQALIPGKAEHVQNKPVSQPACCRVLL